MWSLILWMTFFVSNFLCPWFGVFGASFSNLLQFPKYTKAGITRPSDGLYPWVRLHLIWSVEFNTLDDLVYLCQISLTCVPISQIHKNLKFTTDVLYYKLQIFITNLLQNVFCQFDMITKFMTKDVEENEVSTQLKSEWHI